MIHEFTTKEQELENSQDYGYEFLLSCFSLLSVIDPMLGFTASDAVEWSTTGMFDTVMLLLCFDCFRVRREHNVASRNKGHTRLIHAFCDSCSHRKHDSKT